MCKDENVKSTIKRVESEFPDDLEMELTSLDSSKLPNVITESIDKLSVINSKYGEAKKRKEDAEKKIDAAIRKVERLINKADSLGRLDAKTHKIFAYKWSSKKDRIEALERCVENIGNFGTDTAKLEKSMAEIQKASIESQGAIMEVQRYQMEYMEGTTKAMKFLYGLNAYSIASTESIVTNLQLILSGAKKKDIGEMARQQLFLVMDQLKSQENLHHRMDKTEDSIDDLREEFHLHFHEDDMRDQKILEGEEKDREQDRILEGQIKKDIEHEKALALREKKDIEHDEKLSIHEQKIIEGNLKDKEQDEMLATLTEESKKSADAIEEGLERDSRQDKELDSQRKKDEEHDNAIEEINIKLKEIDENKWIVYLSLGMGTISLILSIVHYFI